MLQSEDPSSQNFNLNNLTLKFLESKIEKKYYFFGRRKAAKYARIFYFLSLIILAFYAFFHFFWYPITALSYFKLVSIGIGFLIGLFLMTQIFEMYFNEITTTTIFILIFGKIISDWLSSYYQGFLVGSLISFISCCLINLNINSFFILVMNLIHIFSTILIIVLNSIEDFTQLVEEENISQLEYKFKLIFAISLVIFQITFFFVCYFLNYNSEKERKNLYYDNLKTSSEYKKSQNILSILVPNFVQINMNKGVLTMSEGQENVAIMFIEIKNFDEIIKASDMKIVNLLDTLFRVYDSLCISNGVQKVETVGKTYMVASGLKIYEVDIPDSTKHLSPPYKLLKLAFEILKYLNEVTIEGHKIQVKIGIHCGTVIAGVIGHYKPQFCLIGHTINTASRICSTADINVVTISKEIISKYGKNMLYSYKEKVVKAPGKRKLVTYQVEFFTSKNSLFYEKAKKVIELVKEKNKNKKKEKELTLKQMSDFFLIPLKPDSDSSISDHSDLVYKPHGEIDDKNKENNCLKEAKSNNYKDWEKNKILAPSKILIPRGKLLWISDKQSKVYQRFMTENLLLYLKNIRILIGVLFFCYLIRTLFLINLLKKTNTGLIYAFRAVFNFMFLIPALKLPITTIRILKFYKLLLIFICFFGYFEILIELQTIPVRQNLTCVVLEGFLIYVIHSNLIIYSLVETFIISIFFIFVMFLALILGKMYSMEDFALIAMLVVFNLVKLKFSLKTRIKSFNARILEEEREQEQEQLISQLIPIHVNIFL